MSSYVCTKRSEFQRFQSNSVQKPPERMQNGRITKLYSNIKIKCTLCQHDRKISTRTFQDVKGWIDTL